MKPINANRAIWQNGKKTVSGTWIYNWSANRFLITLQKDKLTGADRRIHTYGDTPEWGNWKLAKE